MPEVLAPSPTVDRIAPRRGATWRRLGAYSCTMVAGCAALSASAFLPVRPRLIWNASASMPLGLYRVLPGAPVSRGDVVIARLPTAYRGFAAERRYLPASVPLVKRVAATAGQRVCWRGPFLSIDGQRSGRRLVSDRRGRALPWRRGCVVLAWGAVLLLAPVPDSFDGRYVGPTRSGDIVGKAVPLWLR